MVYNPHGGGCCGIYHIFGFDRMTVNEFENAVRAHFAAVGTLRGGVLPNDNRLLEVVLSDRQIASPPPDNDSRFTPCVRAEGGWPNILARNGFELTDVFRNSNSGNVCYRFVKIPRRHEEPLPFPWTGATVIARRSPEVIFEETFSVGDTVRHTDGYLGVVSRIYENGSVAVRWNNPRHPSPCRPETLSRVIIKRGFRGIDYSQPIEIYHRDTGRAERAILQRVRFDQAHGVVCTPAYLSDRGGPGWFHLDSGHYGIRSSEYILRNIGDPRVDPLIPGEIMCTCVEGGFNLNGVVVDRDGNVLRTNGPAFVNPDEGIEPVTVLTEYFARFRSGRLAGPFETQEALREAYPRVLQFNTRRILSNGTVTEETTAFPR